MPRMLLRSAAPAMRPLIVVLSLLVTLAAHGSGSLQAELERTVTATPLRGSTLGISIRDADSRVTLAEIDAQQPMIPASNMKLLTTGAALHVLGPQFTFSTRLLLDGDRLIVHGSGDPGFGDPHLLALMSLDGRQGIGVEEFLSLWVDPVVSAGIGNVRELVVEDRIFDREFVHSTWPIEQLNRRYCAEVAGLNFHLNILHFYPRPSSSGGRPDVSRFEPLASWLDVANSATSRTGKDDPNNVWISRQRETNNLRFYGNVKHEYRTAVPVTVNDMPTFFGRLLAERLRSAGVTVQSIRLPDVHEPPFTGEPVAPVISTPLSTIVERCNRDSQNLYAEALLKRLGAELTQQPGSWVNGSAMLRHAAHERLGSPALAASIVVADGSGLSRDNRVAPATLTAWLDTFHNAGHVGEIFINSLATPGGEGTLRTRFRSTELYGMEVHAKSGYISGVSCLSGYVTAPDGRRRSFSVMLNDVPDQVTLRRARELQEQIVVLIARDLAAANISLGSD